MFCRARCPLSRTTIITIVAHFGGDRINCTVGSSIRCRRRRECPSRSWTRPLADVVGGGPHPRRFWRSARLSVSTSPARCRRTVTATRRSSLRRVGAYRTGNRVTDESRRPAPSYVRVLVVGAVCARDHRCARSPPGDQVCSPTVTTLRLPDVSYRRNPASNLKSAAVGGATRLRRRSSGR